MSWLYPIRFQWLEWVFALSFILITVRHYFKPVKLKLPKNIEAITLASYLAIALICKISQWQSLQLHAFDFWLFEDLIDHVSHGFGMVTKFAPQEPGAIQHGVIHGFWPLILLSPLVWLFGSFSVTLVFNPVVIVLAGVVLVRLMKRLGVEVMNRWLILISFLFHFLVTEMVMHEMHPELIYPLFFFLIWDLMARHTRSRWLPVLIFLMASFKEDSAILVLPVLFLNRASPSQWIALILGTASHWGGMKLAGMQSSTRVPLVSAWGTAQLAPLQIIEHLGGWLEIPRMWFRFMTHSTTLLFLAACPWLLMRRRFWMLLIPYSFLFALMGDRARLINYYSAGFVAIFFTAVAFEFSAHQSHLRLKRGVLLLVALLVGSNGLIAYIPRSPVPEIKAAIAQFNQLLTRESSHAMGVVAGPFLGFVDRSKVWGDRTPIHEEDWSQINYLILPHGGWTNYEISLEQLKQIESRLSRDQRWSKVSSSSDFVQFWLKK